MNDLVLGVVTQLATVTAAVWALTELVGKATGRSKPLLSIILGPVTAAAAYGLGFVPLVTATGAKGYAAAAFAGLIATATAKAFHDLVANPILKAIGNRNVE